MKHLLKSLCGLALLLCAVPALASGIEGEYDYTEKGYSGLLTVKKQGEKYHVEVSTVTDDPASHLCGYEGEATLDGSVLTVPTTDIDDKPIAMTITFKNGSAILDDPGSKAKGVWCGMRGWMEGAYKKK